MKKQIQAILMTILCLFNSVAFADFHKFNSAIEIYQQDRDAKSLDNVRKQAMALEKPSKLGNVLSLTDRDLKKAVDKQLVVAEANSKSLANIGCAFFTISTLLVLGGAACAPKNVGPSGYGVNSQTIAAPVTSR